MAFLIDTTKFSVVEESIYSNLKATAGAAYDNKAKLYEKLVGSKLYNRIIWGTLPADYTNFARNAILASKGTALDIGCGGLIQTAGLYSTARSNYILHDSSMEMLKIAKQRIIKLCGKVPDNIKFVQGDAFNIPFDDNTFDAVFSFGMIHIFENKKAFINEALRVLKQGQMFYFTSLTSDRPLSRIYISLLRRQQEFGEPLSSKQTIELFDATETKTEYYIKGSMVFISGTKLK